LRLDYRIEKRILFLRSGSYTKEVIYYG